jgi:cation transport ATPase
MAKNRKIDTAPLLPTEKHNTTSYDHDNTSPSLPKNKQVSSFTGKSTQIFKLIIVGILGTVLCFLLNSLAGLVLNFPENILRFSVIIFLLITLIPVADIIKSLFIKINRRFENSNIRSIILFVLGFCISIILINSNSDFVYTNAVNFTLCGFFMGYFYEKIILDDIKKPILLNILATSIIFSLIEFSILIYVNKSQPLADQFLIIFVLMLIKLVSITFCLYLYKFGHKFTKFSSIMLKNITSALKPPA